MILVTGATGRIGKELVLKLSGAGHRVRVLVHDPTKAAPLQNPNVEICPGDLGRRETIARAMRHVDRVFLLGPAGPDLATQQTNVVEEARAAGVRHLVKLSMWAADVDSNIGTARAHAEVERAIEASGVPWTHLRPQYFIQNLLSQAESITEERTIELPLGNARVAMVDTRDIAAAATLVLTDRGHEGRAYELTGPEAVSMETIAAKIARITDKPVSYVDLTRDQARTRLLESGMDAWRADDVLAMYALLRAGHGATVTDTIRRLLGYEPRSVDHFVREHAFTFGA